MILGISAICSNGDMEEEIEVNIDMDSFESKMGVFPILEKKPFKLHLASTGNKRLLIQGELDVVIAVPCSRCLKDVPTGFHLVIDEKLPLGFPSGAPQGAGKLLPESDDGSVGQPEYLDGCQLDVDRLVYREILLTWPAKVLCRDDCKGICMQCGADLNETSCNCKETAPQLWMERNNKFKEVLADVDLPKE